MSHGAGGALKGEGGSEILLNQVLEEFGSRLTSDIQMVGIVTFLWERNGTHSIW